MAPKAKTMFRTPNRGSSTSLLVPERVFVFLLDVGTDAVCWNTSFIDHSQMHIQIHVAIPDEQDLSQKGWQLAQGSKSRSLGQRGYLLRARVFFVHCACLQKVLKVLGWELVKWL